GVDEENQHYASDEDGVLFNKDFTEIILYPAGNTNKEYVIPETVETIASKAFYECDYLQTITIPATCTFIDTTGIYSCLKLTKVIAKNPTPIEFTSEPFYGSFLKRCTLYVPTESLDNYKATYGWDLFSQIRTLDDYEYELGISATKKEEDSRSNRIYTIDGRIIANTDNLKPGIYIKNGKKFRVR
ncbi:MAG: leucine-rich repeat domain-containing protein, partial [Bacteroidaceae bacterium]|nr:leucine-rich repeat domain-containing protein [Bacteroidaceae bacterium]